MALWQVQARAAGSVRMDSTVAVLQADHQTSQKHAEYGAALQLLTHLLAYVPLAVLTSWMYLLPPACR